MSAHRLARLTERRDYLDEGATTDRAIAFDPRCVRTVASEDDDGRGAPGAWVHMDLASEWQSPADWASSQRHGADSVFLTREPYADVIREIDCALRGATRISSVTLETPIGDLEWSVRTRNVFSRFSIRTVGQLCDRSAAELSDFPNFGRTCLREVRERLAGMGLALRGEESR